MPGCSYTFLVAGDMAEVDRQTSEFNSTLFWSFLILGLGLIGAILVQVRIGLLPLQTGQRGLARIRDGKARRLDGRFPTEIAPLAGELNSLIQHSEEVVGRARTHVSNLAHFLKTPLSVLAAEADAHERIPVPRRWPKWSSARSSPCAARWITICPRARAAGSLDVLGNRTQVSAGAGRSFPRDRAHPCRARHHDRMRMSADELYFRGERQDLEEMLGNLIDNACKWARARVRVRCERTAGRLVLTVEDDGPGLSAEQRGQVGAAGRKAGRKRSGVGTGAGHRPGYFQALRGIFRAGGQSLGGLLARLELPAIH